MTFPSEYALNGIITFDSTHYDAISTMSITNIRDSRYFLTITCHFGQHSRRRIFTCREILLDKNRDEARLVRST